MQSSHLIKKPFVENLFLYLNGYVFKRDLYETFHLKGGKCKGLNIEIKVWFLSSQQGTEGWGGVLAA